MRTVDLAREHGLSTQAVRNYEVDGILPAAERTPSGYRRYGTVHSLALRAFLALVPAHGHAAASAIMRAATAGDVTRALEIVEDGHRQLIEDRRVLESTEPLLSSLLPVTPGRSDVFVGTLAHRLGVRAATLRAWERAGIVRPRRDAATGYRLYSAADVRDALLAQQLRRGGFGLDRIAAVLEQVRDAGSVEGLGQVVADWRARLDHRRRLLLRAAGALDAYLSSSRSADNAAAR